MRKWAHRKLTKKTIKNERTYEGEYKNAYCPKNRDNFGETSFERKYNRSRFGKK